METNFSHILSGWLKKFQRYKVTYKKGSYHLANLFHSPETMIESFDQMPFCKHDRERKRLTSNTIFLHAGMYYSNPEEGFWIIVSELHFKKNVVMRNLYDKELPLEYHFLNIHLKLTKVVSKSLVNGMVMKDKTWSMFKAGDCLSEYHFKNSEERNITLFFTDKWLRKQKEADPVFDNPKLASFFSSPNAYIILDESEPVYEQLWEQMMELANDDVSINQESIKQIAYTVFSNFVDKIDAEIISENHYELNDADRKNIQRAEQFLNDKLFGDFPGIEKIAHKVGTSPTKLKNDFKSLHNTTLYQYFSSRQMKVAHDLILQKKYSVKEVAAFLGYENASKFSAKFQKELGKLPSQV